MNNTWGSKFGTGFKKLLNTVSGPARLGDVTQPFAHIPGSLISNRIDMSGAGFARGAWDIGKAIRQSRRTGERPNLVPAMTRMIRTAGGLTVASMIGFALDRDEYDEKKRMIQLGGHHGLWVSLDLIPMGGAINGILQARFAKPGESKVGKYVGGVLDEWKNLPGIKQILDLGEFGVADFAKGFVTGRVPGVLKELANAYTASQDPNQTLIQKIGNISLATVAGTKVMTNRQLRLSKTEGVDIPEEQQTKIDAEKIKRAKEVGSALDEYQSAQDKGQDVTAATELLKKKLYAADREQKLTPGDAQRANEMLGLTGENAFKGNPDSVGVPSFSKYNKNADGIIEKIFTWAEAMKVNPVEAFTKLFIHGQYNIARLENGTIIINRDDKVESTFRKKSGATSDLIVDDIVPLELGGMSEPSNYKLVDKKQAAIDDKMENYLAFALHDAVITGEDARRLMQDYKDRKISKDDVVKQVGQPFNDTEVGKQIKGNNRDTLSDENRLELERLGINRPGTSDKIVLHKGDAATPLSAEAYDKMMREMSDKVNKAITDTIQTPAYKAATPDQQKIIVNKAIRDARKDERDQVKVQMGGDVPKTKSSGTFGGKSSSFSGKSFNTHF